MRRGSVVTVGVLAALAGALPAQAKVEGTAYVTGPGVGGPSGGSGSGTIKMDGSDGGGYPVLSGLAEPGRYLAARPAGELGPRYEARLVIAAPEGQPDLVQQLYPYAEGGPVLYTAPGQEFVMSPTGQAADGWFRIPPELIEELRDRGLPRTSPIPPADGAVAAESPTTGSPPTVWGFLLLTGLLVAGALTGRRRAAVRRAA